MTASTTIEEQSHMTHPAISNLTPLEKASLVSGESFWRTTTIEHAGIEGAMLTDGPHGIRLQGSDSGEDHLGIADSAPATAFPTGSALGSSWDVSLLEEIGTALGVEARYLGVDILLGPGVNMKRSPLCGRNFEYFSEDPRHAGVLGAAWVRGIQTQGVGASVKHFAANNQETKRMTVSAEVDERTLREIYFPAFERIVTEADPATVMCSYNRINGVLSSQNKWLLTDVLRGDWGFAGYVVSDWAAVQDPAAALAAGLDLEMPPLGNGSEPALLKAIDDGLLTESALEQAVSRILTVHDRLRAHRGPVKKPDLDAHHALARRAASASSVLLTNDNILPLERDSADAIAVIGELARTPRYQGAGSSHIHPTRLDSAIDAINASTTRPVTFAAGYHLDGRTDRDLVTEALRVAEGASVVVLFLGLPDGDESEGFDREHIDLPYAQLELAAELATTDTPIVVVLSNGGVVDLGPVVDKASAILELWLGGQASGSAAADVLFGIAEPGGRLAETIPNKLADNPAHLNWPGDDSVLYGERAYIGYRWYDAREMDVRFPFGHGLSYTTFEYSDLQVVVPDPQSPHVTVRVTVTNTGKRDGSEVVQLYVAPHSGRVDRPVRELRGFEKVMIPAGQHKVVELELSDRDFAYWGKQGWTVDPGDYTIEVGPSSRSLPLTEVVTLDVPLLRDPLTGDSTIAEWLADPVGSPLMKEMLAVAMEGSAVPATDDVFKLAADVTLSTFVSFGGGDQDGVVTALERAVAEAGAALPASR
ncbi:beta-glucosidase [Pseudarthrobacter sp. NPDC058119]|uniref:beta-glucosidase family protein n=1 Tax=Pseudarthrobacter sp. NPDC058119 TaxID=3346348 RepID=UPI0036DC7B65